MNQRAHKYVHDQATQDLILSKTRLKTPAMFSNDKSEYNRIYEMLMRTKDPLTRR